MSKSPGGNWDRWLLKAMKDVGINSPAELSRALRVDQSIVSRWLRGSTRPSLETLRQLAPVLRRPLEELMVEAGHANWHEFSTGPAPVSAELLELLDDPAIDAAEKLARIRAAIAEPPTSRRTG